MLTCHVLYFNGTYLKDYGSKFKHGFQISSDLPLVKIIVVDKAFSYHTRICNKSNVMSYYPIRNEFDINPSCYSVSCAIENLN